MVYNFSSLSFRQFWTNFILRLDAKAMNLLGFSNLKALGRAQRGLYNYILQGPEGY